MNIKVKDLKKFQELATNIKSNGVIPIHGYLKFGNGMICKNVNNSFVQYKLEDANEEMLVGEQDLFSILNATKDPSISFKIVKGKVELNYGKGRAVFQTPKTAEFTEPPTHTEEFLGLSVDFLESMFNATNFAHFIKDMPDYYGYIHIGEGVICSGDGIMAYHCPIDEKVKIVLEGRIAQFISKQKFTSFSESDNYYFFFTEEATLGVVKSAIGWFDIRKIFTNKRTYSFTLSTQDVKAFNNLSLKLSTNPIVTLSTGKFEMNDMLLDKYHEESVETFKIDTPFSYNPERMNTVLSGLGCEEVEFADGGPCYFLSSKDTKATAIIAKIAKP